MAKPPVLPIDGRMNYFDKLVEEIRPLFEGKGITLDFSGYKETVNKYSAVNSTDFEQLWELSRDFNMWGEYFSELQSLVEKLFLDGEVDEKKEFATASVSEDVKSVANGDRIANKNKEVVNARRYKNLMKSFLLNLESKIDFAYKCHHHCKGACNWIKVGSSVGSVL